MEKSTYLITLGIIGCLLYLYFFRQEEVEPVEVVKEVEVIEEKKETPVYIVDTPKKEDGYHSEWSEWSECNKACGGGIQTRERTYTPAKYGGVDLEDKDKLMESRECNAFNCPENGYHTEWNEWSNCDKECGGGSQQRERSYIPAKFGGVDLSLDERNNLMEVIKCNEQACPENGYHSAWSDWSACNKTCGGGTQSRSRTYTPATNGGLDLVDRNNIIESQICNTQGCPVDGFYSAWSAWNNCDKTCGGGTRTRTRTYTPAINGGIDISPLVLSESGQCNTDLCYTVIVRAGSSIPGNYNYATSPYIVTSPNGIYRFKWYGRPYYEMDKMENGVWSNILNRGGNPGNLSGDPSMEMHINGYLQLSYPNGQLIIDVDMMGDSTTYLALTNSGSIVKVTGNQEVVWMKAPR